MQDFQNSNLNNEIDLRELFITLWAYKLFIFCICTLSILYSGYYALNADKEYSSAAIFNLDQDDNNLSIGGELGVLANLAGFGVMNEGNNLPTDQIIGRIFIQKLDAKLNFQADPYFNSYDPNLEDPIWKSLIKRAIGWQKSSIDAQEAIWQGIVTNYSKHVELDKTEDGSIKVIVTHENALRAANIANEIMNEIISTTKNKKDTVQNEQLSYLSNTLAKALNDLEVSQANLKEFALKNSALPLESFAAGSLQLDALREQLNRTTELHDAVTALLFILQNKDKDKDSYMELRQKFPIVDQVEFRRVLGQNEIISSWSWPASSSVEAVIDTLSERKSRLQSQINSSQKGAERSGLALETFAKLERDATIAEATYTVLIEQVKAKSMIAGYRPDKTEVYEYASPSVYPSAPNRNLILALGAVLGLFIGVALSLVLAFNRGVYYSRSSLVVETRARSTSRVRALLPLRNKSLNDLTTMIAKKPHTALRDMAMGIHKSTATQVVVTSLRAKMTSNDAARSLAIYMQSDNVRVAVINFSSRGKKLDIDNERLSVGSFVVSESTGKVSVLRLSDNLAAIDLLSQRDFIKNIKSLNSTFDLVFLCADNGDAISLVSALEGQEIFHITLARTKRTKSATLAHMRSLLPIQGLFYD
jgi:uncharacterized protein involved in exopolysaccharide biosynthesis